MRYMGGKSRLAKSIKEVILSRVPDTDVTYWEPFVGGCGSFDQIAPAFSRAVGSDTHEDLILMWQAVMDGWNPPTVVTEEEYQELRASDPSAVRGFVGFGCSFGGKWFGGYARGGYNADGTPRNHPGESSRNIMRSFERLKGTSTSFTRLPYGEITPKPGDVVYCDPPYRGTTEYAAGGFDSVAFWDWATDLSTQGVHVFVSEYVAPKGWEVVFTKEIYTNVDGRDKFKVQDRLFQHLGGEK